MKVAVLGLGAMGSRVAQRLLAADVDLVVWNRTPERARPLVEQGAQLAPSPVAAVDAAEVAVTMLADHQALLDVLTGPDGAISGLRPGSTLVEMSTIGPTALRHIHALLPADTMLVDAPVLGSISEAEAGTLKIFVGASPATYSAIRPLLSRLGDPIHVGPFGAGAAAKLVANAALVGSITLLAEILALAVSLGVTHDVAFDVLAATPLAAQANRRRSAVETDAYPTRFRLALGAKDAELIAQEAAEAHIDTPMLDAVRGWFEQALQFQDADQDYSVVLRHILQATGRGST